MKINHALIAWLGREKGLRNSIATLSKKLTDDDMRVLSSFGVSMSWWSKFQIKAWLMMDEPVRAKQVVIKAVLKRISND